MSFTNRDLRDLEAACKVLALDNDLMATVVTVVQQYQIARQTLVEAAIPLEVLAGAIAQKPYAELSPELQDSIVKAVKLIHVRISDM